MSETKNIVIQQNNGIDYDTLYPRIISDEKLFSYWWERTKYIPQLTVHNNSIGSFGFSSGTTPVSIHYNYFDQVWINSDGQIDLSKTSEFIVQLDRQNSTFIPDNRNYGDIFVMPNTISVFCLSSDNLGENLIKSYPVFSVAGQNVAQAILKPMDSSIINYKQWQVKFVRDDNNITYLNSKNRNQYPDKSSLEEWYYTFLGVPFSNALLLSKSDIQV